MVDAAGTVAAGLKGSGAVGLAVDGQRAVVSIDGVGASVVVCFIFYIVF
jgi:hypothetical protein